MVFYSNDFDYIKIMCYESIFPIEYSSKMFHEPWSSNMYSPSFEFLYKYYENYSHFKLNDEVYRKEFIIDTQSLFNEYSL